MISKVRIVNKSMSDPHVVRYNSMWYIINPANGTQYRKMRRHDRVTKDVLDRKTKGVERTNVKMLARTLLGQVYTLEGKEIVIEHGSTPPAGAKPKIVRAKNYCDIPPDAANLILFGEYRGFNPETHEKDLYYHGGDLVRLEEAHEEMERILDAEEARRKSLKAEDAMLTAQIAAKQEAIAELDAKKVEATAKKVVVETLASRGSTISPDAPGAPEPVKKK